MLTNSRLGIIGIVPHFKANDILIKTFLRSEYVVDQLNVFLDHLIPGKDLNAHRELFEFDDEP